MSYKKMLEDHLNLLIKQALDSHPDSMEEATAAVVEHMRLNEPELTLVLHDEASHLRAYFPN